MNNREEFEKWWAETMNIEAFDLHFVEGRYYLCHETERSWMTWQACAELKDKELNALKADRRVLQERGEHDAPCARFCESNAYEIAERGFKSQIKAKDKELDAFKAENIALRKVCGERCEEITAMKGTK
jgi:hypothetical protein